MKRQDYPKQAASAARKTKRLVFDAELTKADPNDPSSANSMILDVFSPFSRFTAAIIDTEGQAPVICRANIPVDDIEFIAEKMKIAGQKICDCGSTAATEPTQARPGSTVRLMGNKFGGKTPAELLIENPSNADALRQQQRWLNERSTDPKWGQRNKTQADAIEDALKAFEAGELAASGTVAQRPIITVYKEGPKYLRTKNEKGDNLVYSIEIICDPGMEYPYSVTISNCWAPVMKQQSGATIIAMDKASDHKRRVMKLTEKEMVIAVSKMRETRREFKARFTEEAWKEIKKYEFVPVRQTG